jgi:hypothetical protein
MAAGTDLYAQVSSAAVLFLRIAAGARAAGMGEAFVAVADDATATHWNPAGLGHYPLASTWFEKKIPPEFRPLAKIALLQGESSETDYRKYDIWALSPKGLVRCVQGEWSQNDVVAVKRDETVEAVLRQYTGIIGEEAEEKMPRLLEKVGRLNNSYPPERLDTLEKMVVGAIPDDYDNREDFEKAFTALKNAYNGCLVDWAMVDESFRLFQRAFKDSALSDLEADKVLFAVEKAVMRFLPSQIVIPFDVNFEGALNDIEADDKHVWVATETGLFRYNGKNWQRFGLNEGLPTKNIKSIDIFGKRVFLGTDTGLVMYETGGFTYFTEEQGLLRRPVSAVAADLDKKAWVVIDNDLYHYDGTYWRNYIEVQNPVEMTAEAIYSNMKIYDLPSEKEKYIAKFDLMNPALSRKTEQPMSGAHPPAPEAGIDMKKAVDSVGILGVLEMAKDTAIAFKNVDSTWPAGARDTGTAEVMRIPFTAGLMFPVMDMGVDNFGNLWIGTDHGLLMFSGRRWRRYGYRNFTVPQDITVFEMALERVGGDSTRAERLASSIRAVNELQSDTLRVGQLIYVYSNPAAARINDIEFQGGRSYFATSVGTIFFDGLWSRYNEEELGELNTYMIKEKSRNLWFVTREKIDVRASGNLSFTMMHVNWLPELANDIYYEFFGYVENVEGWGTIGANITFLSYGKITRTNEAGVEIGDFSAFDIAFTVSYGTPLTTNLSGGISAKVIYSHLAELGAGREKGSGTSTGMALDFGLLYRIDPRLSLGMALTNLGPDVSYIDVSQADPLPRNLAIGLAWKMIQTSYNEILFTVEANKSLAEQEKTILEDSRDVLASPQSKLSGLVFNPLTLGGVTNAFKGVIINGGFEYRYGSFFAFRAGYIHDEEGAVKTPTLGVGLAYNMFKFDFAYIPSSDQVPLANTMRFSLSVGW